MASITAPKAGGTPEKGPQGDDTSRKPSPPPPPPPSSDKTPKRKATQHPRYFVGSYADLPANLDRRPYATRGAAFASNPPPYLTADENTEYRTQHHNLITAHLRLSLVPAARRDAASRARRELWHLWGRSRDEWHTRGDPATDFSANEAERTSNNNNTAQRPHPNSSDDAEGDTDPEYKEADGEDDL